MEIKITEQKDRLVATLAAILTCCLMLTSCTDDDVVVVNPDQPVVLNCMKPDYLKSGDKVVDGKYAGTVAERVSDIRWALSDPNIKAIICNRGGYGTIQLIDQLNQ